MSPYIILAFRRILLIQGNRDRPLLRCELYCVAQYIDHHLIQPYAVTAYIFRRNIVDKYVERLLLRLNLGLYYAYNTVHNLPQ